MPIRPEMKALYPANWPEIRARILARANHRCERCGVGNYWWCYGKGEDRIVVGYDERARHWPLIDKNVTAHEIKHSVRIVLTIAHIHDPDPSNCSDDNLQALCQACHNALDAPMRASNAARTRHARKAIGDLFTQENA